MEAGKKKNPLISIIIPVYNGEKYIGECIRSVCAQTWKKTEILVVDDGSTDGTEKHVSMYADKDSRIRLIRLPENRQLFHARLAGMEAAGGDYLLSVDSDDRISEDYVEQLLLASQKADADLAICDHLTGWEEASPDGEALKPLKAGAGSPLLFEERGRVEKALTGRNGMAREAANSEALARWERAMPQVPVNGQGNAGTFFYNCEWY